MMAFIEVSGSHLELGVTISIASPGSRHSEPLGLPFPAPASLRGAGVRALPWHAAGLAFTQRGGQKPRSRADVGWAGSLIVTTPG